LRLLLDEHYDPAIAEELRRRGIDAVVGPGPRGRVKLDHYQIFYALRGVAGAARVPRSAASEG
jgi:hypothetical protein